MLLDLAQSELLGAELALDAERVDNLADHARRTADADVLVAHRAVLVKNQPVLDAALAEELVAVVAFFSLAGYFEADLAKEVLREVARDKKVPDCVSVVPRKLHVLLLLLLLHF